MMEQAEAKKLLEEFPEMQRFSNRLRLIKELKEDASMELDPELIKDGYEAALRLSERLHAEILTYYMSENSKQFQALVETCNERMRIIEELEDMLKVAYRLDEMVITPPLKSKRKRHLKLIKNRRL